MYEIGSEAAKTLKRANKNIVFDPEGCPNFHASMRSTGAWWQNNNLDYPPKLPLMRLVEPRLSFRGVHRLARAHGDLISSNFFHGFGQVIWENIFGQWNPWNHDDAELLRKCIKILRAYRKAFVDPDWEPYVPTLNADIYAHRWKSGKSLVYTLINTKAEDYNGPVLELPFMQGMKCHDVFYGHQLKTVRKGNQLILSYPMKARRPGCLVIAPERQKISIDPAPKNACKFEYSVPNINAHKPVPVRPTRPVSQESVPNMKFIPGGEFIFNAKHAPKNCIEGGCYGEIIAAYTQRHAPKYLQMKSYFMDTTEVTNRQYKEFLVSSHHTPSDLTHFLKLWNKPKGSVQKPWLWNYPPHKSNHPVVWVDLEDARAYARWAGKRLPTEEEWQYAAQGRNYSVFPWGSKMDQRRCNTGTKDTSPVDKYPRGKSPFGCMDMSGNVWEWTESERCDGHTRYAVIKGGSYLRVTGSDWYITSGAQANDIHEKILLMYPGLDRCGTVGFRCVVDAI